jgi:RNA polymerase sigma-70 factor (ECF subfamily)
LFGKAMEAMDGKGGIMEWTATATDRLGRLARKHELPGREATTAVADIDGVERFRPLLFAIAYRMLGSAADAEDAVQDAFLRWRQAAVAGVVVEKPKAWLTTVITNRCLDELGSARAKRETYVGPWLPEPLVADAAPDVAEQVVELDSLSMAFMVLLETLTPKERAAFLLHDVFAYGFSEIAAMLGENDATCRQLAKRARTRIAERRPRFPAPEEQQARLAERFIGAVSEGDVAGLAAMLTEDVVVWSDGGGKVSASRKPVIGRDKVATFLTRIAQQRPPGTSFERCLVNGQPGFLTVIDGKPAGALALDLADGAIRAVYIVVNPDKLRHLRASPAG